MTDTIIDYAEVRKIIGSERSHLLLGNGFSIACDPVFQYSSLYDRAVERGLSERAQAVFEGLGTNNFEGVMHLLLNANWVAKVYGLIPTRSSSALLDDLEVVKKALVDAVADSHLANTGEVSEKKKTAANAFFKPYHNVFTTNYDLLAYWVVMARIGGPGYLDCFGDDPNEPEADSVMFSFHSGPRPGLFYIHGALHLFVEGGHPRKHCWSRSGQPLTTLIKGGMDAGRFPLFVAEGSASKKLEQIHSSSYLAYALDKFARVQKNLVVFGSALGDGDSHIRNAIVGNRDLQNVFLGVHQPSGPGAAEAARAVMNQLRTDWSLPELKIYSYDSDSAHVWG